MKAIVSSILGVMLFGAASLSAAAEIDVMTQNQYLGADLAPVLAVAMADPFDPIAFNNAVVEALKKIAAHRPAERARALAAEIAQRNPDVVGLQEAFKFACEPAPGFPPMPGMGCDDPAIRDAFTDHLQNTKEALKGKYNDAGKVTNLKLDNVPFVVNGYPALLSIADRDAILVRVGLPASPMPLTEADCPEKRRSYDGCNYEGRLDLPVPPTMEPIALVRGFLAVDVTVKGGNYRVFNTHLEQRLLADPSDPRPLQVRQTDELMRTALRTWNPSKKLIVVGDMNSDPRDRILVPPPAPYPTPYEIFMFYGFTDTWTLRPHADSGLSCCQGEDLANRRTELYERIDMIFSLTRPSHVLNMRLLGNTMGDKTRPPGNGGLWPSDHAALAAKLQFN